MADLTSAQDGCGSGRGSPRWFTAFLALATVGLGVLCTLLTLENRRLKAQQIPHPSAGTAIEPLKRGDKVAGLTLLRRDGTVQPLPLGDGSATPALVFIMGAGCGYCEEAIPVWDRVLRELGIGGESPDRWIRVAAIQTDAREAGELKELPPSLPLFLAQDARATWLRRVNIEPAAVLIGADGVVLKAWLGLPDAADEADLKQSLLEAATAGAG